MSKIIIVAGPAGVGKSTVCKRFLENADGTWGYIEQDKIRNFIHAGFKKPTDTWTTETKTQWEVAHWISVDILKRYQENGINCIVDGFAPDFKSLDSSIKEYLKDIDHSLVVIMPTLETALARNSQRSGSGRLEDRAIKNLYERFEGFANASDAHVIDSTNLSVEDVVIELGKLSNTLS